MASGWRLSVTSGCAATDEALELQVECDAETRVAAQAIEQVLVGVAVELGVRYGEHEVKAAVPTPNVPVVYHENIGPSAKASASARGRLARHQ